MLILCTSSQLFLPNYKCSGELLYKIWLHRYVNMEWNKITWEEDRDQEEGNRSGKYVTQKEDRHRGLRCWQFGMGGKTERLGHNRMMGRGEKVPAQKKVLKYDNLQWTLLHASQPYIWNYFNLWSFIPPVMKGNIPFLKLSLNSQTTGTRIQMNLYNLCLIQTLCFDHRDMKQVTAHRRHPPALTYRVATIPAFVLHFKLTSSEFWQTVSRTVLRITFLNYGSF